MSHRLLDVFAATRADLPEELCGDEVWRALGRLVRAAPEGVSQFGFECRLSGEDPRVDLGLAVTPRDEAAGRLAGRRADPACDARAARSEAWRRLRAFAAAWTERDSLLARFVPFLFLELDADSASAPRPEPSVFVALDPPLVEPAATAALSERPRATGATTTLAVVQEACALLLGGPLPPRLGRRVTGCFDALPDGAFVMHLGAMLGRGDPGVRLSVSISRSDLPAYLGKIGWTHPTGELERCVVSYEAHFDDVQLDFDVTAEAIGPRLGLGIRPPDARAWRALLEVLVAGGLCDPARCMALLSWPGDRTLRLEGYGFPCGLLRELSHVKLSVEPDRCSEAKAYLSVTPRMRWLA